MAKFFLVLTIILAGAAAGVGYLKIYPEITAVKKDLTEKSAALIKSNSDLAHKKDELAASEKNLATTKNDLETANATISTQKTNIDSLNTQLTAANDKVTSVTDELSKETTLYNALKSSIGSGTGAPAVAGSVDQIINDLKAKVAEDAQLQKTLQAKADDTQKRLDDLNKQIAEKKKILLQPGVQGLVMAVNPGWNFVVVSVGDKQGAVANGEMLVKRGDALIGKLKITTVNPTTSIADIVPDSVAKNQRVLPGDEVIFTGKTIAP